MWTCPICQRSFTSKNQWHSCVDISPESLFENKPAAVKDLYDELYTRCTTFGKIDIDTTLSCIYFVDRKRFLAIKPQKTGLILEFVLDRVQDIFPVIKTFNINKTQVAHRMKLENKEDITNQIIGWIEDARKLKHD